MACYYHTSHLRKVAAIRQNTSSVILAGAHESTVKETTRDIKCPPWCSGTVRCCGMIPAQSFSLNLFTAEGQISLDPLICYTHSNSTPKLPVDRSLRLVMDKVQSSTAPGHTEQLVAELVLAHVMADLKVTGQEMSVTKLHTHMYTQHVLHDRQTYV